MKGLEVGCNDYMTKPVSKHELLARIATQLRVQSVWRLEMERDVHEQVPCFFGGQGSQFPRSLCSQLQSLGSSGCGVNLLIGPSQESAASSCAL